MNTNWARILLFTLLGSALGWIMSCLMCAPCTSCGACGGQAAFHAEASCARGTAHGKCCKSGDAGQHHGHEHHMTADSTTAR